MENVIALGTSRRSEVAPYGKYLLVSSRPQYSMVVTMTVRPEKFQFLEKGQNRNFGYKIVISVKNLEFIL